MNQIAQARAAADLLAKKAERAGYEASISPDEDFPETILWLSLSRSEEVGPSLERVDTAWLVGYTAPSDGSRWIIDFVRYRRDTEFGSPTEEASDVDALLADLTARAARAD